MDVAKVLMEYDNLFGTASLEQIDDFLTDKIEKALTEGDYNSALTLMNEMLGFARDTGQKEKGLHYCELVQKMLVNLGLAGTTEYGTALLNVASTLRAFGEYKKSKELYMETETVYLANLPEGDFLFSGLYNNWSLLYEEMGDFSSAETLLRKALQVVDRYDSAEIEQATTRSNLAMTIFMQCREMQEEKADSAFSDGLTQDYYDNYDEANELIDEALAIYEKDGGRDFHYSAALSTKGDGLMLAGEYTKASEYFKRALIELDRHVGRTEAYDRVEERYLLALKKAGLPIPGEQEAPPVPKAGPIELVPEEKKAEPVKQAAVGRGHLECCRDFFERYGWPMLRELFPEYAERMACGMAGEGSDCFGFEDAISGDHDFELGFCIWMKEADFAEIGEEVNREYRKLVKEHEEEYGVPASYTQASGGRRGAVTISDFYKRVLGLSFSESGDPAEVLTDAVWMSLSEENLAAAVNGAVWQDGPGIFTRIRQALLSYYPEKIWRLRLAGSLHEFSQSAQSNYPRMMAREDYAAAELCKARGMEAALKIAYLLNKTYAPYYKWIVRGTERLTVLRNIGKPVLALAQLPLQSAAWAGVSYSALELNTADLCVKQFEKLAAGILGELEMQDLVEGKDTFLDLYVNTIAGGETAEEKRPQVLSVPEEEQQEPVLHPASETRENVPVQEKERRTVDENEDPDSMTKDQLVESIVKHEWMQFDDVKNEGGRADCQDNWNTFSIMRRSQYMAWEQELLVSYLKDLIDAEARGWNMITEKYGRMMQSTAPQEYEKLKASFPERTEEHDAIAEAIVAIQEGWMEEFAKKYPHMAGNARLIHTSEDTPYDTSYETYLRGELGTYSDDTLYLYGRFVVGLERQGKNLAYMIMDNTAKLYGYKDVRDAETKLEYSN